MVGRRFVLALCVAVVGLATPGAAQGPPSKPGCTPELVYAFARGAVDAGGSGVGYSSRVVYTDADGTPRDDTDATVVWSARAVVEVPGRTTGTRPELGGDLVLDITTGAGEHLTFEATCMAGVGAYADGLIVYANGITRGWTGSEARTTFVHFEAWPEGDGAGAYVALVDGRDCVLDFGALLVTEEYATGTGSFFGLPAGLRYSETDCGARFGNPKPALRAPGRG